MATLEQQTVDGVLLLCFSGSLTQQSVAGIEPAFAKALPDGARAVVDLAGVDFITTPGLAMIISASQRLRETQGRVVIASASDDVLALFKRCRLDAVFDLAPTREEGIRKAASDRSDE